MKNQWRGRLGVCFVAVIAVGSICVGTGAEVQRIVVSAGDWDRENSLVAVRMDVTRDGIELRRSDGGLVPLQFDGEGVGWFMVDRLGKGETAMFTANPGTKNSKPSASGSGIDVRREGHKLRVTSGGAPVFEYQAEAGPLPRTDIKPIYLRGGYIHPVFSPSGRLVTDHYARNHLHQHGIWFAWTKTEFQGRTPDFWNMGTGQGRVEFVALDSSWSGPVHGGFRARHRFVDLSASDPVAALNETWEVRAYQVARTGRAYWMFDLASSQECATNDPLILPKYYYGGLGLRGNWDWNGPANAKFLTSDGITNRIEGNETRGRWCHMSGEVDGKRTGIAILSHPDNFRAPQPMRLHPKEPFFCYAPSQLGDWQITPGKPYVSRYRFVVLDGEPDRAELDRLWNDYAHPMEAAIVKIQ